MIDSKELSRNLLQACESQRIHVFFLAGLLNDVACELIINTIDNRDAVWIIDINRRSETLQRGNIFKTGLGVGNSTSVLKDYAHLYRILRELNKRTGEMHIYIPHVYHSIANYLAFYTRPDKVFLLPDGMLNYYHATITGFRQRAHMMRKCVLATSLGGRYRMYSGDLIGSRLIKYSGCHVFATQGLTTAVGKVNLLQLSSSTFEPIRGRSLFLDQPSENLKPRARKQLFADLQKALKDEAEICYKPHPAQKTCSIANYKNMPITAITSTQPAEKIVSDLRPQKIIGICSSALMTLKLLYPNLDVVSVGMNHFIAQNPQLARAKQAMSDIGIRMV